MYEMGDAAVYGHLTEEFKASFRAAYSIFDKSALFLNDYYSLGVDAGAVNFRSVWTEANAKGKGLKLRDVFDGNRNLPLRGLHSSRKTSSTVLSQRSRSRMRRSWPNCAIALNIAL